MGSRFLLITAQNQEINVLYIYVKITVIFLQ
jgi:hypothetical protein